MGVEINYQTRVIKAAFNFQQKGDSAYKIAVDEGFEGTKEEWLASLKQPALDAADVANQAALNADEAAQNADSAADNADEKATLAQQGADNANNKATIAQTAADSANNSANYATGIGNAVQQIGLDTLAVKNATDQVRTDTLAAKQATETATTNANEAANVANNAKGWQPLLVNEEYTLSGNVRVVQKLSDWVGGTGAKPTTNLGLYLKGDGTYTANKDLAANIKGTKGDTPVIKIYTRDQFGALPTPDANTITFISKEA